MKIDPLYVLEKVVVSSASADSVSVFNFIFFFFFFYICFTFKAADGGNKELENFHDAGLFFIQTLFEGRKEDFEKAKRLCFSIKTSVEEMRGMFTRPA